MVDNNAKAPKSRSGDNINPVLANIIKISAILVTVALIVVVTLIVIETIKNNKKVESVFNEKNHITLADYKILTGTDTDFNDISNSDIRKIVIDSEDKVFYMYFYYSKLENKIDKEHLVNVSKISEEAPVFFVNLELEIATEEQTETFFDVLRENEYLQDKGQSTGIDIRPTLDDKEKYPSFIVKFQHEQEEETQFSLHRSTLDLNEQIKNFIIEEDNE